MKLFADLQRDFKTDKEQGQYAIDEYNQAKAYYHSNQLPSDVLSIIQERGQTPITENIYKMIVNKILGYKISSMQEIKLTPRQEQDKPLTDLLNDILKYITQNKNYDKEIIKRDRDLIFGMSVCEVWVTQDEEGKEVEIKTINPESFYIDAFSVDSNAHDARRLHKVVEIDEEVARAMFKDINVVWEQSGAKEKRARVIESWYKEFDTEKESWSWNRYLWNMQGGIYKVEISPFKQKTHPFVISKFYIDEKNRWYGLFRDIKPMQDYINFSENRMVNMMGSFKAMFEEDAVSNIEDFIENMSLDNSVVKVRSGALKDGKIQFLQHHADLNALSQKAEQKRALIKILSGLNDESLGVAVNRQSGVAITQRRESGLMGLQDYLKISDDMDRLLCEKILGFVSHYFTQEQVFSIVDKKVGERYFSINSNESNTIRPCKFDLIFKTQLKTEAKDERFSHWNELLKVISPIRPELVPQLLPLMLKDIDSPLIADLEELLAEVQQAQEQMQQAQAPLQEQMQQLEIMKLQAQIKELEAKAIKYTQQGALAQSHTQSEGINQVATIESLENAVSLENLSPSPTPPAQKQAKQSKKRNKNALGSTWQKYSSAHNLKL